MKGNDLEFFIKCMKKMSFSIVPDRTTEDYMVFRSKRTYGGIDICMTSKYIIVKDRSSEKMANKYLDYYEHDGFLNVLYVLSRLKKMQDTFAGCKHVKKAVKCYFKVNESKVKDATDYPSQPKEKSLQ